MTDNSRKVFVGEYAVTRKLRTGEPARCDSAEAAFMTAGTQITMTTSSIGAMTRLLREL